MPIAAAPAHASRARARALPGTGEVRRHVLVAIVLQPAGRAQPGRQPDAGPQLQHRVAGGRPHRPARHQPHDDHPARRRRRASSRSSKQLYRLIDVLKVQDVTRRADRRARAGADQGPRDRREPGRDHQDRRAVQGPRRRLAAGSVIVEATGTEEEIDAAGRAPAAASASRSWSAPAPSSWPRGLGIHRGGSQAMTATMYYDARRRPAGAAGQTVAIIGYGSQGHAHALNLHDSGRRRGRRPGRRVRRAGPWPRTPASGSPTWPTPSRRPT